MSLIHCVFASFAVIVDHFWYWVYLALIWSAVMDMHKRSDHAYQSWPSELKSMTEPYHFLPLCSDAISTVSILTMWPIRYMFKLRLWIDWQKRSEGKVIKWSEMKWNVSQRPLIILLPSALRERLCLLTETHVHTLHDLWRWETSISQGDNTVDNSGLKWL